MGRDTPPVAQPNCGARILALPQGTARVMRRLSKGIIAAGAGDALAASRHAATAGNALSDEPLVNVLVAQAAQLKGDKENVRRAFEEMAKSPDTEVFGLRGLFCRSPQQRRPWSRPLRHAERALSLNPRLPWASTAVLQVQTARKSWEACGSSHWNSRAVTACWLKDASRAQACRHVDGRGDCTRKTRNPARASGTWHRKPLISTLLWCPLLRWLHAAIIMLRAAHAAP